MGIFPCGICAVPASNSSRSFAMRPSTSGASVPWTESRRAVRNGGASVSVPNPCPSTSQRSPGSISTSGCSTQRQPSGSRVKCSSCSVRSMPPPAGPCGGRYRALEVATCNFSGLTTRARVGATRTRSVLISPRRGPVVPTTARAQPAIRSIARPRVVPAASALSSISCVGRSDCGTFRSCLLFGQVLVQHRSILSHRGIPLGGANP